MVWVVPTMNVPSDAAARDAWDWAARFAEQAARQPRKADSILGELPAAIRPEERRRCQFLFYGAMRHRRRIDALVNRFARKPPRPALQAHLRLALAEILESGAAGSSGLARAAKVVNFAVSRITRLTSQAEAAFANAVLRRAVEALEKEEPPAHGELPARRLISALGEHYSHPDWLVARWLHAYGEACTRELLQWNQSPPPVYLRARPGFVLPGSGEGARAALGETAWPDVYVLRGGSWHVIEPYVQAGQLYIQDPSTLVPVELLSPRPGELLLDACAAPGGKTLAIADAVAAVIREQPAEAGHYGMLVALDAEARLPRLRANLEAGGGGLALPVIAAPGDLRQVGGAWLTERDLPPAFDAVLLDVPCSNTGVLRRRPDAKWRLAEEDIAASAQTQLGLLAHAATLVNPSGRLVYSTCSIEAEENSGVVRAFLENTPHWHLEDSQACLPWKSACDGAGAFLLRRS